MTLFRVRRLLPALALAALFGGPAAAQQLAASDIPAEVRGQIDDMMKRAVLSPPASPSATCGTVTVGRRSTGRRRGSAPSRIIRRNGCG